MRDDDFSFSRMLAISGIRGETIALSNQVIGGKSVLSIDTRFLPFACRPAARFRSCRVLSVSIGFSDPKCRSVES